MDYRKPIAIVLSISCIVLILGQNVCGGKEKSDINLMYNECKRRTNLMIYVFGQKYQVKANRKKNPRKTLQQSSIYLRLTSNTHFLSYGIPHDK